MLRFRRTSCAPRLQRITLCVSEVTPLPLHCQLVQREKVTSHRFHIDPLHERAPASVNWPMGKVIYSKNILLPVSPYSSNHITQKGFLAKLCPIVLMHVESYKPFGSRGCEHALPPFQQGQTSSKYVVVGFAVFIHRFGLRCFTLPVKRIRRAAKHPTGLDVPPCKRANPDATYPSVPVSFT